MNKFYYDLHVHSCLSPCADDENTPNNLAGMAAVCELDIVALTDHNTTRNCPAFFKAAESLGIIPIAGMELTTSEDIHIVCLFEKLDSAMRFGEYIEKRLIPIKNRPEIFGEQIIMDGEDNIIGRVDNLLSVATDISVEALPDIVAEYGGICYPAHIDRDSNGIIAVLGTIPDTPKFSTVEFNLKENLDDYTQRYSLSGKKTVMNSDAHFLGKMNDKEFYVTLDADRDNPDAVRHALIDYLR